MLTIDFDPNHASLRGNVFRAELLFGLWRVHARIRAAASTPIFPVAFWAQVQERGGHRLHDAEGHPVLLLSRAATGDREYTLESCRLHIEIPRDSYMLRGFAFGGES
jgi:hypothetical protein